MLQNVLAATLRNLVRNRLYTALNVGGLAIAFAAAILIGLFVRDDLSFDRFLPGYREIFRASITLQGPHEPPMRLAMARSDLAGFLKSDFPEVQAVARLAPSQPMLRHGAVEAVENVYWADPSVFRVLSLPVYSGQLSDALARPDGLVVTRRIARKYFGRDDVVGATLDVETRQGPIRPGAPIPPAQWHVMRVYAMLEDLPDNTHLNTEVFASGRAPFSPLAAFDRAPKSFGPRAYTYLRLAPGASAAPLEAAMPAFGEHRIDPRPLLGGKMTVNLIPLTAIHHLAPSPDDMKPPGNPEAVLGIALIGVLIVLVAAINFVSLMSARSGQRAVEVGIRKAVGAAHRQIAVQFLGEALALSFAAAVIAMSISELLWPVLAAMAGRSIRPDYLHDPMLGAAVIGVALAVGAMAGLYPALVMSSFRPADVLKGGPVAISGGAAIRQTMAVVQFSILIGLVISALVIARQTSFSLAKGHGLGWERIALVSRPPNCLRLRDRIETLPGVARASCASDIAVSGGTAPTEVTTSFGRKTSLEMAPVDFGLMELHGLRPLAGRFLSASRPEDGLLLSADTPDVQPSVVLNEAAVRRLGFGSPSQAVGQTIHWQRLNPNRTGAGDDLLPSHPSLIVGVVADFSMQSVRSPIEPMLYYVDPAITVYGPLVVRLSGPAPAATLNLIARQARALGQTRPLDVSFYSQIARALYTDDLRQSLAVSLSAGLAVIIACLGLFGLAVFTAERRIKEIGVRKAMGASSSDIVWLLIRTFTQPVLLANVVAWPAAWWFMSHWLQGFAYRIALSPWYFFIGGLAAAAVAALTVAGYAIRLATTQPATALRYE